MISFLGCYIYKTSGSTDYQPSLPFHLPNRKQNETKQNTCVTYIPFDVDRRSTRHFYIVMLVRHSRFAVALQCEIGSVEKIKNKFTSSLI